MMDIEPTKEQEQLLERIRQIHWGSNKLCHQVLGKYLANSGNIGVFCQSEEEYDALIKIQREITQTSDNPNQKYFKLLEPITISMQDEIPETKYTYLYIRKYDPTPYGKYLGDVDFVMEEDAYNQLKGRLLSGDEIDGAEIYDRPGWDNIELSNPEINIVAYVSTQEMAEKVRVKFD